MTEAEYDYFRTLFEQGQNSIVAIKPGAQGEATESHLLWKQRKLVPFCLSPVAVGDFVFTIKDGKLFLIDEEGRLTVLSADRECSTLHSADFGEKAFATPAIVGNRLYLRTNAHLFCFGE